MVANDFSSVMLLCRLSNLSISGTVSMRAQPKVGTIAGSGDLPCASPNHGYYRTAPCYWPFRLIFQVRPEKNYFILNQHVTHLVLVGGSVRTGWTLRTDWRGFCIVSKLIFKNFGDDALLKSSVVNWNMTISCAWYLRIYA